MLSPLISASLRPFLSFLVRTKTFSTHDKPKNNHDVRRKRFNAHANPGIPSAATLFTEPARTHGATPHIPEHPPATKNPPRAIAGTGNSPYLRMLSATSA